MCEKCVLFRKRKRMQHKLRDLGRGTRMTEPEVRDARSYLNDLNAMGMSIRQISRELGTSDGGAWRLLHGTSGMHRTTYEKVLALRFDPNEIQGIRRRGTHVPIFQAQRRVQGLYAIGFSYKWQSQQIGFSSPTVARDIVARGHQTVAYQTFMDIDAMYRKFENEYAEDHVEPTWSVPKTIADGKRKGFAPPSCWDDDTIDDPDAIAQWTGKCGMYQGYYMHRKAGLPACRPCLDAIAEYERERREQRAEAAKQLGESRV